MTIKRWGWWGLGAALIGAGVIAGLSPNYEDAQAATDRQTVDCMAKQLTQDDKRSIAQFADTNDFDSLWRVYDRVFPECTVRGDQRDRKSELVTSAWRVLSTDREFMRLREANAAHAALGH
ncbi:hypothetical protein R69927_04500 [Paraburkholderia domus]|jgi:hypothetical protein|uniref:Uncharacterized protein n=1 Tax=Paraburkholderia domus TaxID=2793075 RepID=A0A9N8R1L3_9BURK|nr:hypothetical protein [Paraburkholderia domus]MBK5051980.1 hypothetical protein [Burkholderia sp. R-70006]MBK5064004.1 hypothetical protein [Burkholderia sp. R-70199]MBK5088979.1 hypothetical protein [Burkholderia sp. R-69927]MBK5124175.1 hypothetical protein [Burkholderia sp. R-69980]MBK5167961.1 hypothetical protein [Burkholderia sp. R-70211]MBK5182945.1 hypothetical protein [Burkholderia sp. R-69749]MCI0149338.1 hypothetical protein [Paraburkholderia sediminicola]